MVDFDKEVKFKYLKLRVSCLNGFRMFWQIWVHFILGQSLNFSLRESVPVFASLSLHAWGGSLCFDGPTKMIK